MKQILPFIDCGHGSMVKDGKGLISYDTSPKKMYNHGLEGMAYEGEHTRRVAQVLLKKWAEKEKRPYVNLTGTNLDIGLDNRVDFANSLYHDYKDKYSCLYISIHLNAGKGTGFEVFTSPGQTKSDKYADILAEELMRERPDIRFRSDKIDGDYDKEDKFYVLTKTRMPAVLCELLFFDRLEDWKYIKTYAFARDMAEALYNFLIRAQLEHM